MKVYDVGPRYTGVHANYKPLRTCVHLMELHQKIIIAMLKYHDDSPCRPIPVAITFTSTNLHPPPCSPEQVYSSAETVR